MGWVQVNQKFTRGNQGRDKTKNSTHTNRYRAREGEVSRCTFEKHNRRACLVTITRETSIGGAFRSATNAIEGYHIPETLQIAAQHLLAWRLFARRQTMSIKGPTSEAGLVKGPHSAERTMQKMKLARLIEC
jgi:hypothetical protein